MYSYPFAHDKTKPVRKSAHRQDLVFVRPPDMQEGFKLSMKSVWFCKVLLLFTFETRTDSGIKKHKCAFVSVMWEYEGDQRPGSKSILIIWMCNRNISNVSYSNPEWLSTCGSTIIYERRAKAQVFYVLPAEYILGKLPVVPVGSTGTIPYSMRHSAEDFIAADFDSAEGAGDGSRWWYVNTWALSWSREA